MTSTPPSSDLFVPGIPILEILRVILEFRHRFGLETETMQFIAVAIEPGDFEVDFSAEMAGADEEGGDKEC